MKRALQTFLLICCLITGVLYFSGCDNGSSSSDITGTSDPKNYGTVTIFNESSQVLFLAVVEVYDIGYFDGQNFVSAGESESFNDVGKIFVYRSELKKGKTPGSEDRNDYELTYLYQLPEKYLEVHGAVFNGHSKYTEDDWSDMP